MTPTYRRDLLLGMRAVAMVGVMGMLLGALLWPVLSQALDAQVTAASNSGAMIRTPAPAPATSTAATAPLTNSAPAGAGPEEDIRDIRGPRYILPAWVLPVVAAVVVMLVVAIYRVWRWRRKRGAHPLLPYERALERLEHARTLMQPAGAREFSIAVSDIVRGYIEQRFEVAVTRRTTEEFLRDLLQSTHASLVRHQSLLADFLHQCDFVKFAEMSLALQDMETLRQSARAFVLATAKPEESPAVQEGHDALPAA
jgi:hypothetical protein